MHQKHNSLPMRTIRVGISPYTGMDPVCIQKYALGQSDCDPGMELEFLSIVATMLNVTLSFVYASHEYGCGGRGPSGNWTGLFGMLQRDEIDLTGNLCIVDSERTEDFDTSWPVMQYKNGFMIKKPVTEYAFRIAAPLRPMVWTAVAATAATVMVLYATVVRKLVWGGKRNISLAEIIYLTLCRWLSITVGTYEVDPQPHHFWFIWTSCFGFMLTIYSTYITVALLNPVTKTRPFGSVAELADVLHAGEYRLLDYHPGGPTIPRCTNPETCEKIKSAVNRFGYKQFASENVSDSFGLGTLFNAKENLVIVNGIFWLELYADKFKRRDDLWLIDDDVSDETWSSYYRSKNASRVFRRLFDEALLRMGNFKTHLPSMYLGMTRHMFRGRLLRAPLPDSYKLTLHMMNGPIVCFAAGASSALLAFVCEVIFRWYQKPNDHEKNDVVVSRL